jgi:hypothetical protein
LPALEHRILTAIADWEEATKKSFLIEGKSFSTVIEKDASMRATDLRHLKSCACFIPHSKKENVSETFWLLFPASLLFSSQRR